MTEMLFWRAAGICPGISMAILIRGEKYG